MRRDQGSATGQHEKHDGGDQESRTETFEIESSLRWYGRHLGGSFDEFLGGLKTLSRVLARTMLHRLLHHRLLHHRLLHHRLLHHRLLHHRLLHHRLLHHRLLLLLHHRLMKLLLLRWWRCLFLLT